MLRVAQAAQGPHLISADVGLCLNPEHAAVVLNRALEVSWFGVRTEDLTARSDWLRKVDSVSRAWPLWLDSMGLSLGSPRLPLPEDLSRLGELISRLQPDMVSDHLAWSTAQCLHFPAPYSEAALAAVIRNVIHAQDRLKRQILLEIPARVAGPLTPCLAPECFLAEVVLRTGCGIVLDLNNLQYSALHSGIRPGTLLSRFLEALEPESILAMRLAVDTAAWKLFHEVIETLGAVPTVLEWGTLPASFDRLKAQVEAARAILLGEARRR